jgi:hypothetical protein
MPLLAAPAKTPALRWGAEESNPPFARVKSGGPCDDNVVRACHVPMWGRARPRSTEASRRGFPR